jgi:hypothetical protein
MKKFSELIEDAVNCVKTYNRVIKTIDSHADDFLAAVSAEIKTPDPVGEGASTCASIKSNVSFKYSSKTPMNVCSSSRSFMAASAMKTSLR